MEKNDFAIINSIVVEDYAIRYDGFVVTKYNNVKIFKIICELLYYYYTCNSKSSNDIFLNIIIFTKQICL
jgi:hypothetical protein